MSALSNRQIARAALIVLLGFAASGLLGVIRQAAVNSTFGASTALDSFFAAQRIPELLFVLVAGGALGSSFIPVFSRFLEQSDQAGAWRLASAVTTIAGLAAAGLALVIALLAEPISTSILAPAAPAELQQWVASLMRIMLLTVPIFAVSGLSMGILNAHQSFTLPALAAAMYNLGQIFGALVLARVLPPLQPGDTANVYGLAWGTVLGALLHLLIQVPGLRRLPARLRVLAAPRVDGAREVLLLMLPRVLGLAVVQINFLVNVTLAYPPRMVAGSYTAFTVAWQLMFFVLGVVAQSVGTALFPTLSALAAAGDLSAFRERLSAAVRSVLFLALPATAALIVFGETFIRLLFERGQWTALDSQATAWALAFLAIGIAGHALLELLSRAFYALSDTRTPVTVGVFSMMANIALSLWFVQWIGSPDDLARGAFAGLALANSLTTLLEAAALWLLLRRRLSGLDERDVLPSVLRASAAALVLAGVGVALLSVLGTAGVWVQAIVGGGAAGLAFFGTALLIGSPEARTIPALLLRRFRR